MGLILSPSVSLSISSYASIYVKNRFSRTSELTQRAKGSAVKTNDLSLIPGTYVVEGETGFLRAVLCLALAHSGVTVPLSHIRTKK